MNKISLLLMSVGCLMMTSAQAELSDLWNYPFGVPKSVQLKRIGIQALLDAQKEEDREQATRELLYILVKGTYTIMKHTICLPVTIIRALDDSSKVGAADVLKGLAALGVSAAVIVLIKEWIRLNMQSSSQVYFVRV